MAELLNITLEEIDRLQRYVDKAREVRVPVALQRDSAGRLLVLNAIHGGLIDLSNEAAFATHLRRAS